MTFNKDRSAGYLANHMARLFAQGLNARITEFGLSPGQFPALLVLWKEDGLTQRELVKRIDVEQATMANTLIRMERDGLIMRQRHPADGRAQQIWLTKKAKDLEFEATKAAQMQNEVALKELNDEEREQFLSLMQKVIKTLKES
ncbi:MAG: MarR family transcriptional regulator [Sneathiellales bacterium]|nr:MarR family transcriptional regulator [Sneathiellales bacterium]